LLPGKPFRQFLEETSGNGDRLTDAARMTRYSVRHQFGHAKDYQYRDITGHLEISKDSPFRVAAVEEHELEVVLQEFFCLSYLDRGRFLPDWGKLVSPHAACPQGNTRELLGIPGRRLRNPR
jgi:hypothetical protein